MNDRDPKGPQKGIDREPKAPEENPKTKGVMRSLRAPRGSDKGRAGSRPPNRGRQHMEYTFSKDFGGKKHTPCVASLHFGVS